MSLFTNGNNAIRSRVEINDYELPHLNHTFKKDVTIQNAYHLLHTTLFERGLKVVPDSSIAVVEKPEIDSINYLYNKYVLAFLKDALKYYIVCGYVCFTMVTVAVPEFNNSPFTYPISVPPESLLKSRIVQRDWQVKWEVKERSFFNMPGLDIITGKSQSDSVIEEANQKQEQRYYISFFDGYEPDIHSGEHLSPVKIIQDPSARVRVLEAIHTVGTVQRARPPFVVIHAAETAKHEGTLSVIEKTNPAFFYKQQDIKRKKVEEVSSGLVKEDARYGHGTTLIGNNYGDLYSYKPTTHGERMELPPGIEVSGTQPTMPEVQQDLKDYRDDYRETVAFTIGVPFTFLSSTNRHGQAGKKSAEDTEVFQNTLGNMKKHLCELIERIYVSQFPALKGKSDLHFDLLTTPYTSPDNIQKLVDRDVISTEMGKEFTAAAMGINRMHIIEKPNEHLTIPINGNEHQTGPRLKLENDRIEAERQKFLADAAKLRAEAKAIQAESTGENNEGELIQKEAEMKKMEIEGKLEIMDKQMELTKVQTDAAIQKMKVAKATAIKKGP